MMNTQDDDYFETDLKPATIKYCACGSKTSFGCEDQCRVCFYSARFLSKSMDYHLAEANVSHKAARRALKIALHFKNNPKEYPSTLIPKSLNKSLFLGGKAGIGKTTFAILSMIHHMEQFNTTKENFAKGKTFWFETVPDILLNLRRSFKLPHDEEVEVYEKYKNVDFLILDDFGVEKSSDWSYSVLYSIINHRYEDDRLTVFTSNLTLDQIAEKNGDERITRRIKDWCDIIELSK